ncbi:MAG TPA: hypothetical protein VM487_23060 [Phycisphaerae bacterium]|nr:hypothetical protein [Phycisphaerae bacterium]
MSSATINTHVLAAHALRRNLNVCRAILNRIGLECDRIEELGGTWSAVSAADQIRMRLEKLAGMNGAR